ncbi:MAG: hypothetical protein K2Q12_05090 [Rickettsiales bacterium]|nr:hypothetical protein [Rickettsiales bacterium]
MAETLGRQIFEAGGDSVLSRSLSAAGTIVSSIPGAGPAAAAGATASLLIDASNANDPNHRDRMLGHVGCSAIGLGVALAPLPVVAQIGGALVAVGCRQVVNEIIDAREPVFPSALHGQVHRENLPEIGR